MGITYATYCIPCAIESPEVGDFGHIGRASLDDRRRGGGTQNFGYIYEGFRAVSILTPELEAFHAFLDAHDAHRLVTVSDLGSVEGERDEIPKKTKKFRGKLGRFRKAGYQVECLACSDRWSTPSVARFRSFRPFRALPEQMRLFKERVLAIDPGNFYRVGDRLLDPEDELGSLGEFVLEHLDHEPTVRLIAAPSSPVPRALR